MFSIGLSWLEFTSFLPARLAVTLLHFGKPMYLMYVTMFINMLLHGLHFDMCVGLTCRFGVLQVSYPTCIVVQLPLSMALIHCISLCSAAPRPCWYQYRILQSCQRTIFKDILVQCCVRSYVLFLFVQSRCPYIDISISSDMMYA